MFASVTGVPPPSPWSLHFHNREEQREKPLPSNCDLGFRAAEEGFGIACLQTHFKLWLQNWGSQMCLIQKCVGDQWRWHQIFPPKGFSLPLQNWCLWQLTNSCLGPCLLQHPASFHRPVPPLSWKYHLKQFLKARDYRWLWKASTTYATVCHSGIIRFIAITPLITKSLWNTRFMWI